MDIRYAEVVVAVNHFQVDRVFSYRVPSHMKDQIREGMVVTVPFGKGNRTRNGFVLRILESTDQDPDIIKDIQGPVFPDPVFSTEDLELARWMQKEYNAPLSAGLSLFIPKLNRSSKKQEWYQLTELGLSHPNCGSTQRKVLELLTAEGRPVPVSVIRKETGISSASLASLIKKQWIERSDVQEETEERPQAVTDTPKALNEEQYQAYLPVAEDIRSGNPQTSLLHGITGSGKTEVYMHWIREALELDKEAIVLVPEISLTPQLIDVFTRRFGDRIGVTHSRMTDRERSDLWFKARNGEVSVVIGPRSALFTPFRHLGLVILDEEHETTYKSEQVPRYHTRETAIRMAALKHFPVVLGSATPSVESFHEASEGTFRLLTMRHRAVPGAGLPAVEVVDMRQEMAEGNLSIFCRSLFEKIQDRLDKKEQVILFLNRKGYSTFVNCRSCGFVLKCPRCFLPYTWHKEEKALICHHCGKEVPMVEHCPNCGSQYIRHFGTGTQRVEEELKKCFPNAGVLRMDTSVVRGEETYQKVYEDFRDRKADILVGTQMIAKGFDFPYVTLVGVLSADMILYSDDFHSTERTYQLLTQVAGRAGRGGKAGEVIIQAYSPEHYAIQDAKAHDYDAFYRSEIAARMLTGCPPFTHILQFLITGRREQELIEETEAFHKMLLRYGKERGFQVLNPAPASLERINNVFRRRILVKLNDRDRLMAYGKYCREKFLKSHHHIQIQMDIDPMFMV